MDAQRRNYTQGEKERAAVEASLVFRAAAKAAAEEKAAEKAAEAPTANSSTLVSANA